VSDEPPAEKKRRSETVVLDERGTGREAGEVSPDSQPYLVVLHPPGAEIGKRIPLERHRYAVGRDPGSEIPLERDSVSRNHGEVVRTGRGEWIVRDLGSTNGTFVNERQIQELELQNGDQLRFGDVVFKFLTGGTVESVYHEEIYQMTVIDGLTGVHNKRYLLDFLERELASAHRHRHPLTLVMFDIDHFKQVNDTHGHVVGDAVLRQLAQRIKPRIRREDLLARYGGEEFAAVLTITGLEGGLRFAESLRQMVGRRAFQCDKVELKVSVSLGVTTMHDEPQLDPVALIQRADQRLYDAKRNGRNRVEPPPVAR
jgi:diguanylate cyclase (GGDEF)-like protein